MTPPERRLRTRPDGFKFRRQHPFGPYTLDFFCHQAGVAIEIDGFAHELGSNPDRDERRDAWVGAQGVSTLRFRALNVRDNLDGILVVIVETCRARTPS